MPDIDAVPVVRLPQRVTIAGFRARWYAVGIAGIIAIGAGIWVWYVWAGGLSVEVLALLLFIPASLACLLVASWMTDVYILELQTDGVRFVARVGGPLVPWNRVAAPQCIRNYTLVGLGRGMPGVPVPIPYSFHWELSYQPSPQGGNRTVLLNVDAVRTVLAFPYRPRWLLSPVAAEQLAR